MTAALLAVLAPLGAAAWASAVALRAHACEECGEPDLPGPGGEPGDAEVDIILRAVADPLPEPE